MPFTGADTAQKQNFMASFALSRLETETAAAHEEQGENIANIELGSFGAALELKETVG
jgi:hypothetical protein